MRRPGLSLVYSHWSGIAGGLGMLAATIATQVIVSSTGTGDPVVIDGAMQATESFAPLALLVGSTRYCWRLVTT